MWSRHPNLQELTITVDKRTLDEFPRVLRASTLPALRSLKLKCENYLASGKLTCPVLEGRFEQLNEIKIEGVSMKRNALDAVLRQVPNLTHLDLERNDIGAKGCGHLAEALREHACPSLTHLHLQWI